MSGGQPPNIKKWKWNKNKMYNKTANRRNKIPYRSPTHTDIKPSMA